MTKLPLGAQVNQGKPKDVVGFWVLKKYVMSSAIWGKACTLMFSMDPQFQFSISNCIKSPIRINLLLFSRSVMSSSFATP